MIQIRTKQQVAFDGVRTAWQSDAFTQILHKQVVTKFSMDGVIPNDEVSVAQSVVESKQQQVVEPVKRTQGKFGKFVGGTMDGVQMPFGGQAYA